MTRKEYMELNSTVADTFALHREYQAQFVTGYLVRVVVRCIGEDAIRASTDPHMNDIPLECWDRIAPLARPVIEPLLREQGDSYSLSMAVCTTKEAARQFKEGRTF